MTDIAYSLAELPDRLRALGARHVLVVCAPSRRFVDRVLERLAGFATSVFDGAKVHVPVEVVDAAVRALADSGADTIVTVGGGAAVGLGKALRLAHEVRFVAIPTTYAGSERTNLYGTTRGRDKQTGRDDRVRPDVIVYDVAFTRALPIALTVQSLLNALAHVISTGSVDHHAAAAQVVRAIEDLLTWPTDARARDHALRAASECAVAADRGKPGAQHGLAHLLGGALAVEHAALHAILLPQFVSSLPDEPRGELERALGRKDLASYLHDLLVRAGAPVSLAALGATREAVDAALATRPELPASLARDAFVGLRPARRLDLGTQPGALHAGPMPEHARRIVVALHGRGAEAGTILRRYREIAGDPTVCVIAPRAEAGADRWYAIKFDDPAAGRDPEVERAIARVNTTLDALAQRAPGVPVVLAGFSQGACLALEVAARRDGRGLAGVIAPCGGRIGSEWRAGELRLPVLLGAAHGDKWIPRAALDATAAWLRGAGATVTDVGGPGERHEIAYRQRVAARAIVRGVEAHAPAGFGNTHAVEELPGALPPLQSSPRVAPYELYAEQVNATPFTTPRADNVRSWLYRARPSVQRRMFAPLPHASLASSFDGVPAINLTGFAPLALPAADTDFVDGLATLCGAGSPELRRGYAFHRFAANRSMEARAFYDADGDLLVLPELGALTIATELGPLRVAPGELAVIPRGLVFSVLLHEPHARGYVAESFGGRFRLPERGLVGANGLADARHFRAPAPFHEDRLAPGTRITAKLGGALAEATQDHSPFDVVAWHGTLAPYAYDLAAFSPVGNTRFDHGDPSIYTVLTSPDLDLIVFPPRIDATTNTFRPPFFHRNAVSEINGIVREQAHPGSPFEPGCCFLTPALTAHGVSRAAVERSRQAPDDAPVQLGTGLWFQLESALPPSVAPWATPLPDWPAIWGSHPSYR